MQKRIKVFLKKRTVSISLFIMIIAFYQATYLNSTYYQQVWSKLSISNIEGLLFFCSMPVVVFCVIAILLNILIFPRLIKLIASLLIMISVAVNYFMSTYRIMIDRDMLQNALDTNQMESFSLITPRLITQVIIFGLMPVLLIILIRIKPIQHWVYYLFRRLLTSIIAVIVILLIGIFFYKDYATFMRNNSGIIKYLTPSNYIAALYQQYDYLKYKNLPFIELGDDAKQLHINSNGKKNVIILVVGETARAKNFSLGNYEKETNSLLAKQAITYFPNTSSCGTSTAYSLPCMFSNMAREDYDPKKANKQSNMLDILQKSGINILWVDNDGGCKGVCDRVPTIDATKKYQNDEKLCKDGVCYDEVLLQDLPDYLDNVTNDTLIILHTIGSHGPTYYQRYPKEYQKFTPTCDTNEINYCSQEALVNTYDNTIVYTDAVVDKAINLLKNYDKLYNTALMYISDHGESLGENNIYLHAMPYAIAPEEQTQVPLLLWLSTQYQQQQAIDKACLDQKAKDDVFSQDNLFHSLLGLFDVRTEQYTAQLDLLKSCQITHNQ
ncbi:phosphoethanolamine transferase EptA [Orbus wheelerorum]|uniref:phosphoethanolamine transferase EptA n=1 Tax=Orbus wheelerorum TaxID=3074111 RepID=UPI00370DDEFE